MTWTRELDEAALLATRSGQWHVVLFYLLCGLAAIPTSFLVFSQVFTNATPEHWCAPQLELDALGLPDDLLKNLTIPGHNTYEECRAYKVDLSGLHDLLNDYIERVTQAILATRSKEPKACTNGWRYSTEHYRRTLVTDVCCSSDY
ncbi:Organic cation transporter 1 [Operophtera brumata]|uniref:Organic cation transporter 1 n=1 Tax=Operophtera brumata TaxID=104452 RepID=A0A0L7L0E9_OPEBR|nr:Organic cation transporter 1 [Operophtera brumata]